ncbi:DsbA family protein [Achromobacter sp. ACRQX]|uniref:DsbA family protein n=1 Tax=Achromobacter sp. ACRQX TaxID=2918181 RepID=UPI001EF17DBC|nr:DsbA family protein [Achromobacter sp. ACRQX]MCG7326231.1 DsbA family protein [Achromobacter sp. ACRQX]
MSRLFIPVNAQDHAEGPDTAPVTLVEYGDYECPYCGEAYPVLKAVQRALGDRLRFVFRNFPISELHPDAVAAAEFAEAAAEAGKFWQAHDMLYERQNALKESDLFAYGEEIGLSPQVLHRAFGGAFDSKIEVDFSGGVRSGVNGTPTLFINGVRYDGPRDADSLIDALNQAARTAPVHA